MSQLRRREFLTLFGGAAAWPIGAGAERDGTKTPRIGIMDDSPLWNSFRGALRDLGYLEGQNVAFESRTSNGTPERLAEIATELVRLPVDLIATFGTPPTRAAKQATTTDSHCHDRDR